MPRLKDRYLLETSRPNFQIAPADTYYSSLNNSFDFNERLRNDKYLAPITNINETVLTTQRKVNELKELLADRESQLDWVKRTLKYTEINELKQENEMLYTECKRLKRYVGILCNKLSHIEATSEIKFQEEVEDNITDPILKQKFSKKKSMIEALLEENNKMNNELENARKENLELKLKLQEGEGKRKSAIRFSVDNGDSAKTTPSGKKAIRKGDSKIVRQKTGYNSKTRKIISDSK